MTDSIVQKFFIETFEEAMTPVLTFRMKDAIIGGKKETQKEFTNICYPNKAFIRPDNGYWFELFFVTSQPFQEELGSAGRNRWQGIFQVNICVPKDIGTNALNKRFDLIASKFKRGYITNGLRILSVGRVTPHSFDDYYSQPISIAYEADLDN